MVVPDLGAAVVPIGQVARIEFGIGGGALWGFTLIADYSDNKVVEVDEQGRETFVMEDVYGVWDARCLDNGNLLITEFSNSRVFEATRAGQIVWEFTEGLRSPNAAERLPNGNTLIANTFRQEVIEVSKEKKVVWRFAHVRPFDAERLPSGNTLIADMLHDRVIEVDAAGKIVWQVEKMPSAYDADRLPNGNTLITLRTLNKVVEVDREEGDLAARQAEHPERRGPPAQRQHAGGREQRRARVRPQRQRGVEEGHDVGGGGQRARADRSRQGGR